MRDQARVFGEVADLYDQARAGYSDAVVDRVLDYAGGRASDLRALEIGAGTGKATVAFANRGVAILALEPDLAMAAIARRNCERFANVRVEQGTFEDTDLGAASFGLVLSAQAWHWVRPEVRAAKAASLLRPGGALALLWHRTNWEGEALRADLDEVYRRLAPDLYARGPGFPGLTPCPRNLDYVAELNEAGLFTDACSYAHPWASQFTADSFVALLMTQSDHRLLDERDRAPLVAAVRAVIAAHGGEVTVPHVTLVVLARSACHPVPPARRL